jgi:hypothetical protein
MTNTKRRVDSGMRNQPANHPIANTSGTVAHSLANAGGALVMQPGGRASVSKQNLNRGKSPGAR